MKKEGTPTDIDFCGRSNYHFSMGDKISDNVWDASGKSRGIFWYKSGTRIRDIVDGTSNTIAVSEKACGEDGSRRIKGNVIQGVSGINTSPQLCMDNRGVNDEYTSGTVYNRTGRRWPEGTAVYAGFTTVLPPNAPSCLNNSADGRQDWGIFTPSSYHPGGVNGVMADGSVRFFSETIDTGRLTDAEVTNGASPYGVWGELGSKDGGEAKSSSL